MWSEIENIDQMGFPGIYGLSDAFLQIRTRFERAMKIAGLPGGPLTIVGAWHQKNLAPLKKEEVEDLDYAFQLVFAGANTLPYEKLVKDSSDIESLVEVAKKLPAGYAVSLQIADGKSSCINLIDQNLRFICLLRFVLREELRLFIRIADREGNAVFLDELYVSPTFIIDPMISALGGFVIRFDKNSAQPQLVDFGSLSEGGEHVMRINDAFHQPFVTPPLSEFVPPEYQLNQEVNQQ